MPSKRANLYYLEYCRVLVRDGRVEYVTDAGKESLYWNIPIANTTSILLGTGTSITQSAMRELSRAGVMVGFSGGGGTPLLSAVEGDIDVAWLSPQSEYRPTSYLQKWVRFWFAEEKRLEAAKRIQLARMDYLETSWRKNRRWAEAGYELPCSELSTLVQEQKSAIQNAPSSTHLLTEEARAAKKLYRLVAGASQYGSFTRQKTGSVMDPANIFLNHGNYLAYGLGATATWVLGLPHALAVMHGKTRRGGLVFDAADLVKDAIVLPQAFLSAVTGDDDQAFRGQCIAALTQAGALDFIIETLEAVAEELGGD